MIHMMTDVEILLLTNNIIEPFQIIGLDFVYLNKLFATQSLAEHGLGFLISLYEKEENPSDAWGPKILKKIIFDLGGLNKTFLHNINVRGYSLYDVNCIALSHWHYDHMGALYEVLEEIEEHIPVVCHQDAQFERFFKRAGDVKNSDLRGKKRAEIVPLLNQMKIVNQEPIDEARIEKLKGELIYTKEPYEIFKNEDLKIILSGEIPRIHPEEEFSNFFSLQDGTIKEDQILDDKCMIFEFGEKVVLLNGCCHSGIMNTIDYVKELTQKPITHIIGGFHMSRASDKRIKKTIDYLQTFQDLSEPLYIFPIHCTGRGLLKEIEVSKPAGIKAYNASVGTRFTF